MTTPRYIVDTGSEYVAVIDRMRTPAGYVNVGFPRAINVVFWMPGAKLEAVTGTFRKTGSNQHRRTVTN